MSTRCLILGAGGHARVLVDALLLSRPGCDLVAVDPAPSTARLADVPIFGDDKALSDWVGEGFTRFMVGLGLAAGNDRRKAVFEEALAAGLHPLSVCHPSAILARDVEVCDGAMIFAAAVINPAARIGANAVINTAAVIEHDCVIGDHAFVAPGARVLGSVTVGEGAIIGAGAVVLPGASVAPGALVAAGSVEKGAR